jgi:hypothetical protein
MRSLQGALIIAGVFQAVIGFFGIWRVFIRFVRRLLAPCLMPPSPIPVDTFSLLPVALTLLELLVPGS